VSATLPARTIVLKSSEFRRGREESWKALEILLDRAERRGIRALAPAELEQLPLLYRQALSSLSVARAIALDRHLLLYLEDLSLRAFLVVYGPRRDLAGGVRDFLKRGFPLAVQGAGWHVLITALVLLAGCIAGYALTMADVQWFNTFVPHDLAGGRGPNSTRQELLDDEIFQPWPGLVDSFIVTANFLFRHNTMVGILSFSLGFVAGIPTLLLIGYQGLVLGAFVAIHARAGLTYDFIGWLSIHGVTELGAIILCGGGGLLMAEKVLFPGRYSRVDSLARIGGQASRIALGAVLLFFLAGILEGGFRQLVASTEGRLAIGWSVGACWIAWLSWPRKRGADDPGP
jgi:uncharacterized membrane protein SpoIIM required for sporulation